MRTLATPQRWPPGYLDEVSLLLAAVPYSYSTPNRPRDTEYGLRTAIAELKAWLEAGPSDKQNAGDRRSFAADVTRALSALGPAVSSRTPAAAALTTALHTVAAEGPRADRELVGESFEAVHASLSDPRTSVAALEDLIATVRDPLSSYRLVTTRLAVFNDALELSDRASAEICHIIGGVLDDQALEISAARHSLDGTPAARSARLDEFAGLAEEQRLELCRRLLVRPAEEGHHVVWVAFNDARVNVDGAWRQRVGMLEFFDGPTLIETLNHSGSATSDAGLPDELQTPIRLGGHDVDVWPRPQEHARWVAARVDLGRNTFSNPVQVARAQADAVVELAAFRNGNPIWTSLAGVLHLFDGRHHSSEKFHISNDIQHQISVDNDATAAEFPGIASSIAAHLPIVDPALRTLLGEIGVLNASASSGPLDLMAREVTVVETVTRMNGQPPADWAGFLRDYMSVPHARSQAIDEIFDAVSNVLSSFAFEDAARFNSRAIRESLPDGRMLFKRKVALELVPELVADLPDYHTAARRLRDVARRTRDVTQLGGWVNELVAEFKTKIDRASRLRNGLSHAGPAPAEVTASVRLMLNRYARQVAGIALEAVVAGSPVKQVFNDNRIEYKRWHQRISAAANVPSALFDLAAR